MPRTTLASRKLNAQSFERHFNELVEAISDGDVELVRRIVVTAQRDIVTYHERRADQHRRRMSRAVALRG